TPFDRAVQAKRQPGSAFKPFVYATAIEGGRYTEASVVLDTPELVVDPATGKSWKPENDERGSFEGPMTLRRALAESKNTVAVKLIESLGPGPVIDLAHRAGIVSALPQSLTLGLGTGEVSLLELTNAYATFDDAGAYAPPRMILRVVDRKGKLLEDDPVAERPAVKPEVAFVVTDLLRGVIEEPTGTGRRAKDLPGPLAGKTGTATEERDAWFVGYSTSLVAGAWVGFDDHRPMGSYEQGAHAALPIWISFMKQALARHPPAQFAPPPGVVFATVDAATGKLAAPGDPDGLNEPFLPGTQPTATALPQGQAHGKDLFLRGDTRGQL
ncbi:MAG: penicillin-binding transpeptidase domain-containing protein, partial [Deltaproteobacteria bacterium]